MSRPSDAVARYYDRNTWRFLMVGGRGSNAIHRQLWGPGVSTVREAEEYVNRLVVDEISARCGSPAPTVLDMGCGVGGTLFHLADRLPDSRLHGVTVSRRQHDMAERLKARTDRDGQCRFTLANFETMELGIRADVIVAVESFVHASSPPAFFESVQSHSADRGHVIVIDDFLAHEREMLKARTSNRVRTFERGWRLSSLCTVESCAAAASRCGLELVEDRDLTPLTRQGRPRDRVIAVAAPVFEGVGLTRVPLFANMVGGNALQIGLREGFLAYRMLVFQMRAPTI